MIRYGSVCSGIEAATVAWGFLDWEPQWFCEIESFPKRVLRERFPNTPDLGDMTEIYDKPEFQKSTLDLLVGGTPCQSFSQAGRRLGLDDPRGNLALNFLKIARTKQPRWIVWENVPGVLSSGNGDDFATIIKTMVDCGYGVCWRMLDAQYFGLPQCRKRVFVVGHLGKDWRRPAAVLFERQTLGHDAAGGVQTQRRIPVCTVRNAGNANARGVVVAEDITFTGESDDTRFGYDGKNLHLRRLTPAEEERRMGFSGYHTAIPDASDTDRYKAIGNSMAVPVMRWIGEGIKEVDSIPIGETMAKYTDEQKQEVAEAVKSGKSNKDIVAKTGVQTSTVSAVRRSLKGVPISNSLPLETPEERARIIIQQYPDAARYLVENAKVGLILP